jgi:hypothetical protein
MPVAGGMKDTPINAMGVLTNLAHESGRRRCMSQKGSGSRAPTRIAYIWGWYIDPGPNCRLGPIRPLHKETCQQLLRETRKKTVPDGRGGEEYLVVWTR